MITSASPSPLLGLQRRWHNVHNCAHCVVASLALALAFMLTGFCPERCLSSSHPMTQQCDNDCYKRTLALILILPRLTT